VDEKQQHEGEQDYLVERCVTEHLDEAEREACIAIVKKGEAVDPEAAEQELARANVLVVVRKGRQVVGVGAIKRPRPGYAAKIMKRSGHVFPPDTPELGYVAVDPEHRGNHLSPKIVAALLAEQQGPLFATTDCERMKSVLSKAGFLRKGDAWKGKRGQLSLWLKD
jgi:RimJ/RimL family protein N-acetyltransferase